MHVPEVYLFPFSNGMPMWLYATIIIGLSITGAIITRIPTLSNRVAERAAILIWLPGVAMSMMAMVGTYDHNLWVLVIGGVGVSCALLVLNWRNP